MYDKGKDAIADYDEHLRKTEHDLQIENGQLLSP
jgi:hypothetical protein